MTPSVSSVAPRWPIGWLFGLMTACLLLVALAQQQGWHETAPEAKTVWELSLKFEDLPNGDVRVTETESGKTLAVFSGEQGFLRGSLRAMARQRRIAQTDLQAPLTLRALDDGRLMLLDPTQEARIDLDSFGPSNKAVFMGLRSSSAHASVQQE
jgi:putative photosynthetic complex assembly protein